jgi:hypothetical protein
MEDISKEFINDKISLNETIINIWKSRKFQIGIDVCRILLVIITLLILYKLTTEIEIVKQINNPIQYFEMKTNLTCSCFINNPQSYVKNIPSFNLSKLNFTIG